MSSSRRTTPRKPVDAPSKGRTLPSQQSIHGFGRVAKALSPIASCLKRKLLEDVVSPYGEIHCRVSKKRKGKHASGSEPGLVEDAVGSPAKKKNLAVEDTDKSSAARPKPVRLASDCKSGGAKEAGGLAIKKRKHAAESLEKLTIAPANASPEREPSTRRHKRRRLVSPTIETPTKGTSALLDALTLKQKPNVSPFTSSRPPVRDTPLTSPTSLDDCSDPPLSSPLQRLIKLHSSFLAALSLHYAHNGSSTSVDLELLLPRISDILGTAEIDVVDLRRILAIMNGNGQRIMQETSTYAGHTFSLTDYGPGKLCLDIKESASQSSSSTRFIDEDRLNALFERKLRSAWIQWHFSSNGPTESHVAAQAFINQLPLAQITVRVSLHIIKPIFAKGQKRLEELKAGPLKPQPAISLHATLVDPSPNPSNRSLALLERIRAKQLRASCAPNAPSKADLDRKAALYRLESIVAVLTLVATGTGRKAFSMHMLVQQVQGSLRNPMSREEVERCLVLLAEEVAPGFVSLVRTGRVTGVVVDPGRRIGMGELAGRVAAAVAAGS